MPTLLEPPETEANPFQDLIGGEDGAPAYQVVGGRFGEVPKAEINTPTDYGPFADLVPTTDSVANGSNSVDDFGPFSDLIPASSTSESEKALAETPKPKSALVQAEIDLEKLTGIPVHQVMNSTRVYGNAAGKYIFSGLQGLEIETAKALKNPPSELTTPQAEAVLLPQEQQDALEQKYLAETQPAALDALARAEYFKQRAEGMDEFSEVDPALAHTIPARLAAVAGEATMMGMEALVPGVGLPLMVMHGALATEAEALNHGQTPAQAEAAAVRSAIGLAIFGGTSKVAAVGMAKLIPQGSEKVVKFLAQFFPQTVANETSSRAIAAWNAASDAPQGEKIERAVAAFQETTLEQSALNTAFALIGASKAAGARPLGTRPVNTTGVVTTKPPADVTQLEARNPAIAARLAEERAVRPVSEPVPAPVDESGIPAETARYAEPLETRSHIDERGVRQVGPDPREDIAASMRQQTERMSEPPAAATEGGLPPQAVNQASFQVPPIVQEMANAAGRSAAELRGNITNVRYGEPGQILFEFQGKTHVAPEPRDAMPAVDNKGTNAEASRSWALKEVLDGRAKPTGQTAEPPQIEPGITSAIAEIQRRNAPSVPNARDIPVETVPEYLRRDPEVERLLSEPGVQTGPQMKMAEASEGGALFSAGGKRTTVTPKGATPKGDTEFIRIEHGVKRMFKGLERHGDADTLGSTKNKVGQLLSAGMRKHTDLAQEIEGQLGAKMEKAQKGMTGKTVDAAFDEIQSYIAAKENGRPLPTLSKKADQIWKSWQDVAVTSGNLATANNVQVLDAATGKYRPGNFTLGEDHIPRVLHPAVERAMRDPKKHSVLWNDLVDAFAKQRGLSEADAANQLRAEASQIRSAAVMGNLERGRGKPLPEIFYDYDLRRLASGYIPAFSERMAQIIAYGQRLGSRENPQRPNLWDIARGESENTRTQEWLNSSEDRATNVRPNTPLSKFTSSAQTATSGLYLSSPTTTVQRNIISGFLSTVELAGVRRSISNVARAFKRAEHSNSREIGAVKRDMGALLHADMLGDSALENAVRGFTRVALKYSGYSPGESWVRTHGFLTSSQFAREGVATINKRPSSMRSKEALGLFKRMRVDAEKIVAEKGEWETGPETRRFIREFIKATQGGYRFDQVPGFAQSNTGRFLYQFGRWGTQRAQNMARNGIRPMFGETVEWHGKKMSRVDLRPIAKMGMSAVVAGETFGLLTSVMFGKDRKDASLSEIREAWKDDEKLAVAMAVERLMNDVIMSGMFGFWGQPFDWAKSLRGQSRFKNPLEPPGLGAVDAFKDLGQAAIDQGGELTKSDLLTFGRKVVPGVIQTSDVARNIFDESLYEAQNDVKTLRAAAQRWAKREGMDVASKSKGNDWRKSELAPDYEPIKEALLVGDAQRAEVLAVKFLNSAPDRAKAAKSLRASVKASQPFRAGPYTSETHHTEFREWARKNLSKADYQQTERIQERYVKSAKKADLW